MAELNQVLWTLDNEIQPRDFERLCVDMLGREGYRHIEPNGGTKDNGKDAEIWFWRGISDQRSVVAFQFSLEKKWERKLSGDTKKIAANCSNVVDMVFVTSQKVTGAKKDKLKKELKSKNGWELTIFDREWLRHRLSEFHQDLAKKYLGLDLPPTVCFAVTQLELSAFDEETANDIFQHSSPELLKASIVANTRKEPQVITHWYNLARIEYLRRDYDSALEAINKALQLETQDKVLKLNLVLNKGTILAEKGMKERSRPLLVQAKEIFADAAKRIKRPQDLYNLANVLGALGEIKEAGELYARCVELKPDYAQAWKNFGSLFVQKKRPDWGIECFDKALKIMPDLVEAHLSKATALLIFFKQADQAIQCFETAYKILPDLDRKWRYSRYWFSRALQIAGRGEEALKQVEVELAIHPGDKFLLNQKASVLSGLRKQNQAYEEMALEFFKFRADAITEDYSGLAEVIEIYTRRGQSENAWKLIEKNLPCKPFSLAELAQKTKIPIGDFQIGFQHARLYKIFRRQFSVEDHCITLRNHGLSPSKTIIPALNHALIVPFGMVAHRLRTALDRKESHDMQAVFTEALNIISRLFPSFGGYLLAEAKPRESKEQVDLLTAGMLILTEIVVAETARIEGFIAAKYRISQKAVQEGQIADWKKVGTEIAVMLLEQVGKDWQLVK
jgi:tetratricopeptide (TPR) repeat protein